MNKRHTAVTAGMIALAGLIYFWPSWVRTAQTTQGKESHSEPRTTAASLAAKSPASSEPTSIPSASRPESLSRPIRLTDAETDVLVMYDEMANAFDQHMGDCTQMASAVTLVVSTHESALLDLQQERHDMTTKAYREAQTRLEAAQGSRLAKLRHAVEQGVAKCGRSKKLMAALKRLGSMSR